MTPTKEEIKKWLKSIEKDRDWLAEQCFVKRSAVNSWLSTDRGIPPAKLALIKNLMEDEIIDLELPDELENLLRQKAEEAKKSIDDLISEILLKTVQEHKKKKQESGVYQNAVEKLHIDLDEEDPEEIDNISLREVQLPDIMVVGNVAAGESVWDEIDEPYPLFKKPVTALRVSGTSMEPEIKNGQVVLVRPVPEGDDLEKYVGKIIVYEGNEEETGITLKRLVNDHNQFFLAPVNQAFKKKVPIHGKVKAVMLYKLDPCQ